LLHSRAICDIAGLRAEARRLLAEAGVDDLSITLASRKDAPIPYGPAGDFVVAAWREIGVPATQEMLSTKDWQTALETGHFAAATTWPPTISMTRRYSSRDTFHATCRRSTLGLDRPPPRRALCRPGAQHRPTVARPDGSRFRATLSYRCLYVALSYGGSASSSPRKTPRMEHDTEPIHRPRSCRRMARGVTRPIAKKLLYSANGKRLSWRGTRAAAPAPRNNPIREFASPAAARNAGVST